MTKYAFEAALETATGPEHHRSAFAAVSAGSNGVGFTIYPEGPYPEDPNRSYGEDEATEERIHALIHSGVPVLDLRTLTPFGEIALAIGLDGLIDNDGPVPDPEGVDVRPLAEYGHYVRDQWGATLHNWPLPSQGLVTDGDDG